MELKNQKSLPKTKDIIIPKKHRLPFNPYVLGKGSIVFDSRKNQQYLQVSIDASKPHWVKIPDEPKKGLLKRILFWK